VTVVVGVDGAGRTHRLDEIAAAADRPVVRVNPPIGDDLSALLDRAERDGALVLVDDAHRLTDGELAALARSARRGVGMVVARRPTLDRPDLAELDEAVGGRVEQLGPLDADAVARLTGSPPDALARHRASAGLPGIAAALGPDGSPSPTLVARVQRRLAPLDPAPAGLARLLALRLDLADPVLAAAADLDPDAVAGGLRVLRDVGFLVPGSEAMVPAVAEAILADLPPAERRRAHDAVARALIATGADPLTAAGQLRAARARTPAAAQAYRAAGDRLRFDDPAAAIAWYDDAAEAGADAATLAAGRAESSALLGLAVDASPTGPDAARLALVDGAVEAHHGRAARAARALAGAGEPGPLLAVPSLVATGDSDGARAAAATPGPPALRRLAEASLAAATDPVPAVPLFIEAAEHVERTPPVAVLPDTPHALGALAALVAGDAASAEHLLGRALEAGVGGPVAVPRHRLLLAWVRLRIGRYDTAVAELARADASRLPGRERLLLAALSAGLARRGGDIGRLREAWAAVEPALARHTVDLFTVEQLEELAVAAARLRHHARVAPVLDALDDIVGRLGQPPAWAVAVGWVRLQVAIAGEDPAEVATAAARLTAEGAGERARSMTAAAAQWARILVGEVDPDGVMAVAERLAAVELPWEASRLVGQAAIRTTDPGAARRLLERARELSSAEVVSTDGRAETLRGGLSEREVEVARMVLAGGTYREIGGRLFISPKTVEHHVARIRTKLGATTRAEFIAALRDALGDPA